MNKRKICFVCKKNKLLTEFYSHPKMPDGTVNKCKECSKIAGKENWNLKKTEKLEYDKYRNNYSIPRIFNHTYYMLKSRSTKIRNKHNYTAYNKPYLSFCS
jgi:hypothetical protein